MPIKVVEGLPVREKLEQERVYTITETRALTQQIRPLRILILNLMPRKEVTELQFLRLLGNTPLQIEIDFMYTQTYESTNTPTSHLLKYYKTYSQIKNDFYDGMIVTGAPVETMPFEEVIYCEELKEILDWSQTHVYSRFFVCWGAQFALNYYYGIEKLLLEEKLFGVFSYANISLHHPYLRGFDDYYNVPQSRHTTMDKVAIVEHPDIEILSEHPKLGPDLLSSKNRRDIYAFGHLEYDRETLADEYHRDLERGDNIQIPYNYYPDDDTSKLPIFSWKSHGYLLFNNWINETYQDTYYDLTKLKTRPNLSNKH